MTKACKQLEKINCDWSDTHNCILHYTMLTVLAEGGLILNNFQIVLNCKQWTWLKKYISRDTAKRVNVSGETAKSVL